MLWLTLIMMNFPEISAWCMLFIGHPGSSPAPRDLFMQFMQKQPSLNDNWPPATNSSHPNLHETRKSIWPIHIDTYTHDFQLTIIHIWIHDTWPYGLHHRLLTNGPWYLNTADRDADDCCWFPSSPTRTKRVPAIIKTYRVSHTDDLVSILERSLPKRSYDYYKDIQTWYSIYNGTHVIYVTQ